MSEERIDKMRRQIAVLINNAHKRMDRAEQLLRPRAGEDPSSPERQAHELVCNGRMEIETWLRSAGEQVGIPFTAAVG